MIRSKRNSNESFTKITWKKLAKAISQSILSLIPVESRNRLKEISYPQLKDQGREAGLKGVEKGPISRPKLCITPIYRIKSATLKKGPKTKNNS